MHRSLELKLDELHGYPLLASVGVPLPPQGIMVVPGWDAAVRECRSRKWDNLRIAARNTLQRMIERRDWALGDEWNAIVEEARPVIMSLISKRLVDIGAPSTAHKPLLDSISWDFLGICLENEFAPVVPSVFYIKYLEPWYVQGRFPCGCDGKALPDPWNGSTVSGRLIVF